MTRIEAEVIIGLADNGMNVSKVAQKLFMDRSSVYRRIHNIHDDTGKNPLDFFDLLDLLPVAKRVISGFAVLTISERAMAALERMGQAAHKEDRL